MTLWSECERLLLKKFLETEEEALKILPREKKGTVLPADRLEFTSAFEFVRRDIALSRCARHRPLR